MIIKANAKINLSLYVAGKDKRNYHFLEMIMLPITLFDKIQIEKSAQLKVYMDGVDVSSDENNTVVKAYRVAQKHFEIRNAYKICITKHIPAMAGLGGGSSDGAAVLKALCQLEKIGVSLDKLAQVSLEIGSDVPFFIYNQSAYVSGFGEKIAPFINTYKGKILLVKPPIGISTKAAYEKLENTKIEFINMELIKAAWINQDLIMIEKRMANSLEHSAFLIEPELAKLKAQLKENVSKCSLMSGSGSTFFAIAEHKMCEKGKAMFEKQGYFCHICEVFKG